VEKYFIRLLYIFMDTFQITVLIIAAVLLILIFTTIGILTKYGTVQDVYPPVANNCPDYWIVDNGHCKFPSRGNPNNINGTLTGNAESSGIYTPGYSSDGNYVDFSDSNWGSLGKSALCAQKDWATTNNISWDGVSNYNSCD
jgi:hypothetical protein